MLVLSIIASLVAAEDLVLRPDVYDDNQPPIALFHGLNNNCPGQQHWADVIGENYNNTVKCFEIGNGKKTSIYTNIRK
jgi:hypothetical protein